MRRSRFIALLLGAVTLTSTKTACAQDTLTLAKAVEIGRRRSPEIASAKATVDQSDAEASSARAQRYPTLSASLSGQASAFRDTPVIVPGSVSPNVTYTGAAIGSVALRWNVYDFGKTSSAVDAADASTAAAAANRDQIATTVTGDVAATYISVAYREELKKTAGITVAQRDKLLILARGLVKQGLQPPVEEIRAESRLDAAKRTLASADADALEARQALGAMLGLEGTLRVSKPKLPMTEVDSARAAKQAEAQREAIRAARANVDAKTAAKDAARARYLPTLSFSGDASYRFAETDVARMMTSTRTAQAGLVVSGTLFDAGISAGVDRADAALAAAEAQLTQTLRDSRTEASRAAIGLHGATQAAAHAKRAEEQATTVFAVVQARYEKGLATPMELIDAESSDVEARTARTIADMNQALAAVRLLVATGQAKKLMEESFQ